MRPDQFYPSMAGASSSAPPAPPAPTTAPKPGTDDYRAAVLFGGLTPKPEPLPGPSPDEVAAEKLFPSMVEDDGTELGYEKFEVPADLTHLGLQHDADRHREFSLLARQNGLSQAQAQQLVNFHLRQTYGSARKKR